LAITSLAFMLVDVPEPVWKMSTGNSASHFPSITSRAALRMAPARLLSSNPSEWLTVAAAHFTSPIARMNERGNRRSLIGKFSIARAVCTP